MVLSPEVIDSIRTRQFGVARGFFDDDFMKLLAQDVSKYQWKFPDREVHAGGKLRSDMTQYSINAHGLLVRAVTPAIAHVRKSLVQTVRSTGLNRTEQWGRKANFRMLANTYFGGGRLGAHQDIKTLVGLTAIVGVAGEALVRVREAPSGGVRATDTLDEYLGPVTPILISEGDVLFIDANKRPVHDVQNADETLPRVSLVASHHL